jgi:hypothetical protein
MNCAAAKGFLTQAECGAPAATTCAHCARPMCPAHLSPASGFTMCYDCTATQQPQQEQQPQGVEYDDAWARGYRSSYYTSTGYRPYDRSDIRAFDERRGDLLDDDAERGGFDAS